MLHTLTSSTIIVVLKHYTSVAMYVVAVKTWRYGQKERGNQYQKENFKILVIIEIFCIVIEIFGIIIEIFVMIGIFGIIEIFGIIDIFGIIEHFWYSLFDTDDPAFLIHIIKHFGYFYWTFLEFLQHFLYWKCSILHKTSIIPLNTIEYRKHWVPNFQYYWILKMFNIEFSILLNTEKSSNTEVQ